MTVQKPIPVDLFGFVTQGSFDCVRPGQTKDWILSNFPEPDSRNDMGHNNMSIWLYGTIEFHFAGEVLFLIHCDNFRGFGAGEGISLDKWLLANDGGVPLTEVLAALHQHKVSYAAHFDSKEHGAVIQIASSKVQLYFGVEDGEDYDNVGANSFTLEAFSLLHPDFPGLRT